MITSMLSVLACDTEYSTTVECHDLTFGVQRVMLYESRADVNAPLSENLNKISVTTNF